MTYEEYKARIAEGFTSEAELNEFIDQIADDYHLSGYKYLNLRCLAINKFYEG